MVVAKEAWSFVSSSARSIHFITQLDSSPHPQVSNTQSPELLTEMVNPRNNTEASQPLLSHQRLPDPVTAAAANDASSSTRFNAANDDEAGAAAPTPAQLFKHNNMSGNAVLLQVSLTPRSLAAEAHICCSQ